MTHNITNHGNENQNHQWDITSKRRTLTIIGECVGKLEPSYIVGGAAVLENVVRKLHQKLKS